MPAGIIEAVELFFKYGSQVWLVMPGLMIATLFYAWLVKADPSGFIRDLLNRKKQRLIQIRTMDYLSDEVKELAERELKQLALHPLTGIFNYRLQPLAVEFCHRFNQRPRYLASWRSWLSEEDGQIRFDKKWCQRAWWGYAYVNLPLSFGLVLAISGLAGWKAGIEYTAPAILLNMITWCFPWLMFSSVPTPAITRVLETDLEAFNNRKKGSSERDKLKSSPPVKR